MGDRSAIEWTDATWNPIRARNLGTGAKEGGTGHFCIKASAGCRNCYAERDQPRFRNPVRYAAQDAQKVALFLDHDTLLKPLSWSRPRLIFPGSMTDLFLDLHEDDWLDRIFAVMALTPRHTYQVVSKRTRRMRDFFGKDGIGRAGYVEGRAKALVRRLDGRNPLALAGKTLVWPLPNVWAIASAEDQDALDERMPDLAETPAAVRGLSIEPMLGPITLGKRWHPYIDWVIVGGESGPNARPIHPDWVRSLRDECAAAGIPYFFKQWGEWGPIPDDMPSEILESYDVQQRTAPGVVRLGKKAAGRLLDGIEHNAMPGRPDLREVAA